MSKAVEIEESEEALQAFVAPLPQASGQAVRTLAHAWRHAGGALAIGGQAIRLLERDGDGTPCTTGTLYADRDGEGAMLEIVRVNLQKRGLTQTAWDDWADEREELTPYGFDPAAKYPRVQLAELPAGPLLRLAVGLRDLHLAVQS